MEKIRKYSGNGKFIFKLDNDIEISSNFSLLFFCNGKIELYCYLDMFSENATKLITENNKRLIEVSLNGDIESPKGKITIEKLYINSININFKDRRLSCTVKLDAFSEANLIFDETQDKVDIHFGLVNFIFGGYERTQIGEFGFNYDKFSVEIENSKITFKQSDNYKIISEKLKKEKTILPTSEAIVSQCDYSENDSKKTIIDNTTMLISFASGTYVTWIYEDIVKGDKIIGTKLLPHKTINYHHRDLVIDSDHLGHCDLKSFLEGSYKKYVSLKEKLGLFAVIEYYVSSKSINNLLEIKYLVAVTSLDCLTSYLSDYFMEKSQTADLSTFKNRLIAICKEFNVTYTEDELDFIKIRDKIVHTGKFPQNKSPLDEYHNVINFIDRIVLNILGYSGEYLNIRDHYKKETFK